MKINQQVCDNMINRIYDVILDKSHKFIIYVSPCMYAYLILSRSYKKINKNYKPTILNHHVLEKEYLHGDEYEVVKV